MTRRERRPRNVARAARALRRLAALGALAMLLWSPGALAGELLATENTPWWVWPLGLFVVCFLLGVIAVPAGVGGGVLFVPIVSGFFPFHLDFVRGAGLLVALASALAAGPSLLRAGLADLRLALPVAVIASATSIAGALIGFALPTRIVQLALGVIILAIVAVMATAARSDYPLVPAPDRLAGALRLHGVLVDRSTSSVIAWQTHRTPLGLALFAGIGLLAGMFGMGAGWANVPVLNLVMGAPLKLSAGTSSFILSLVDSAAAWVYLLKGAVLAIVAVPSVIGMMLGARIGARLLGVLSATAVRRLVIGLLLFAGGRALLKGILD
ncbi:MAG: sulfite exporter TauE/SafE family protein [Betaproteobacteria bacterium]|nr:sulfite exporter TauE/SafE family protein [Betaproteobacteria bacterium]